MADGIEFKRLKPPARIEYLSEVDWPRPTEPAPSATAAFADREHWSSRFVPWFFSQTGGEPELLDVPAGHRWRAEYFKCVANPEAFEGQAEQEIRAYRIEGGRDVEGN